MRMRRGARWVAVLASSIALVGVAGAQAKAPFAGKPRLVDVDAYCVTKGADKGHVYVELAVRYPDAPQARGYNRHDVAAQLEVLNAQGEPVAIDSDRGRAQVDIPELSSYVHTHQHRLSRAVSKVALGGKPCGAAAAPIRVSARFTQKLSGGGAKGTASVSAAPVTQTSAATATATVDGVPSAPTVENGCVFDSKGQMDCSGAFLQKVSFVGEALAYANFSFANMLGADLAEARLGHATMNKTVLDQADLADASLGSASLTSASMLETNLAGAAAPYANFAVATLAEADLRGANLTGANLAETKFENGNLCDAQTILPGIFGFGCSNGSIVKR